MSDKPTIIPIADKRLIIDSIGRMALNVDPYGNPTLIITDGDNGNIVEIAISTDSGVRLGALVDAAAKIAESADAT